MHIRDYIEHLKSKPEDVRRRIALGSSAGITALVAIGWAVSLGTSGTLALTPTPTDESINLVAAAEETKSGFSDLLGAASAFNNSSSEAKPGVTIVDSHESSTLDASATTSEKTVIPF